MQSWPLFLFSFRILFLSSMLSNSILTNVPGIFSWKGVVFACFILTSLPILSLIRSWDFFYNATIVDSVSNGERFWDEMLASISASLPSKLATSSPMLSISVWIVLWKSSNLWSKSFWIYYFKFWISLVNSSSTFSWTLLNSRISLVFRFSFLLSTLVLNLKVCIAVIFFL